MGVFNKFSVDGGATFQEIEDENGRKMLAPIESDATSASKAYAVGEFLSLESTGKLYKVTAAIASGSAIVTTGSGANVTEDTVGGEIKSVKETYTSRDLLNDTVGWTGKNLAAGKFTANVVYGVTYTVDNDNVVHATGQNTSTTSGAHLNSASWTLKKGSYILSAGDSMGTFAASDIVFMLRNATTNAVILRFDSPQTSAAFELAADTSVYMDLVVGIGISVDNYFYPMIRRATEPAGYEPYHDSVKETLRDAEVIEGENLCPFDPYTGTVGNVACTSKNGSVLVLNGTCNANVWIGISANGSPNDGVNSWASLCRFKLKAGSYVLFSSIPKSSLTSQHAIGISDGTNMLAYYYDGGNNVFTLSQDTYVFVAVRCQSGVTYTNDEIDACIKTADEYTDDPSYAPYYEPLKDRKLDITDEQVLGAWNLARNTLVSMTINGITATMNDDGSVTLSTDANGATAASNFDVFHKNRDELNKYGSHHYYMSGCPKGGSETSYQLYLHPGQTGSTWNTAVRDFGDGVEFDYDGNSMVYFAIRIAQGTILTTPITFKPMISLKPNMPYVPYVMTNRELTEKKEYNATFTTNEANVQTLVPFKAIRKGCMVNLQGYIKFTATFNAGSNIDGSFSNIPQPLFPCSSATFGGTSVFGSQLSTDKTMRLRLPVQQVDGNSVFLNFTYFTEDLL